jgi:ATP-dependent Clp protease ATP-binding subunit ClpA
MLDMGKKDIEEKGIELFQTRADRRINKRGYSLEWGARPLARVIEDSVESYLAIKI